MYLKKIESLISPLDGSNKSIELNLSTNLFKPLSNPQHSQIFSNLDFQIKPKIIICLPNTVGFWSLGVGQNLPLNGF